MKLAEKYRETISFVIPFLIVFFFVFWPVKPMKDVRNYELHEIVGVPEYSHGKSKYYLKVNGMNLKCDLGGLGGSDGCGRYRNVVDTKKSARITYISMPTRLWYHYEVLYSFEQNGRMIITPEQLLAEHESDYISSLALTRNFLIFLFIPIAVLIWFRDFSGKVRQEQEYFKAARKMVDEKFLELGVEEEDEQFTLRGRSAEIVLDKEIEFRGTGYIKYQLTRFVRNPDGEYFMLMFDVIDDICSMPLCKHVTQTNARIALKEKYKPLASGGPTLK
jgi:hypothetical protein